LRLQRPSGTVDMLGRDVNGKKGPALGLFRNSVFPTCRQPMHKDDLIVLYTDGLIEEESPDEEIFSPERLGATIASLAALPPKAMLAKVLEEVRRFAGHPELSDDVCLLGVEVNQLKS